MGAGDAPAPPHRPAHVVLLEGAHPDDTREHRGHGGAPSRVPTLAPPGGDRELGHARAVPGGDPVLPAAAARGNPKASPGERPWWRRHRRDLALDAIGVLLFGALAVGIIGAGLAVVLADRISAAALLMAFAFLCNAGMFVLLGAETIAAFQVLIYVGAITVL
ncbi:MAG: hypothetical protein EXR61_06210, partial [Chloroflexi bacterium]|nr:hypothetical protein [Chloroflexota bacterium]